MFQSFKESGGPTHGLVRLNKLRKEMNAKGATVLLIPHADEHQNEYLPAYAERLAWLSGFTGSAGFCIVTQNQAVLFVDGRYSIQVLDQIDQSIFTAESLITNPPSKWLEQNTIEEDIIAYDPWLITQNELKAYHKAVSKSGAKLEARDNLIDAIWDDQPEPPLGMVKVHDVKYAGKDAGEKLKAIKSDIEQKNCTHALITDPASIAWLFNIRGSDMIHNPLSIGNCLLPTSEKPSIYMDARKFDDKSRAYLEAFADIKDPDALRSDIEALDDTCCCLIDPDRSPIILVEAIHAAGSKTHTARDPIILPKAIKNQTEIEGARSAHLRDGVAMIKFLCWLDNTPTSDLDEIVAAQKLEQIRTKSAEQLDFPLREISFDTISGFGSNGAINHYRVNENSNLAFEDDNLFLLDSGAQYDDGTTDITRTIAIGNPPKETVEDATLVLKGHIALALARFPKGTRGIDLDVLARNALWQKGKDYAHGTGHGVGSYLNVHEGPQGIHRRAMQELIPGMIISNEPGYYVEGKYGIRIENLILVNEPQDIGGNIETLSFETLTFTPIDLRLVDASLLDETEKDWLNQYHKHTREMYQAYLSDDEKTWLEHATRAI